MDKMSIEQLYQEIGHEAVSVAGKDLGGRLLVYGEVEEGAVTTDLLYVNRKGDVQVVLGPHPLLDLVYALWHRWKEQRSNQEWRVMCYVVDDDGKLTIDLTYPEDVDDDPDYTDRRDKAVEKYFGHAKVIYPNPFA